MGDDHVGTLRRSCRRPDGTRLYENRTALVLRTRWFKIVEQHDFYVDTAPITALDRKLTETGIQAIPKAS